MSNVVHKTAKQVPFPRSMVCAYHWLRIIKNLDVSVVVWYLTLVSANRASSNSGQGPVSRKFRELFGSEKPVFKLQSACFEKLISEFVLNVRKAKRTAKFDGFEHRRCEDMKGIVVPEIGRKVSGLLRNRPLVI